MRGCSGKNHTNAGGKWSPAMDMITMDHLACIIQLSQALESHWNARQDIQIYFLDLSMCLVKKENEK